MAGTPRDVRPAAEIAHDARNALTVLCGHSQFIQRQPRQGERPDPVRLLLRATAIGEVVIRLADLITAVEAQARDHPDGSE